MSYWFRSAVRSPATFAFTLAASFSKYVSKARAKRIPLNTKRVGRGFKKGYGARKEGLISSKGRFRKIKEMCTELVVPDLTGFTLKPYIGPGAKRNVY